MRDLNLGHLSLGWMLRFLDLSTVSVKSEPNLYLLKAYKEGTGSNRLKADDCYRVSLHGNADKQAASQDRVLGIRSWTWCGRRS